MLNFSHLSKRLFAAAASVLNFFLYPLAFLVSCTSCGYQLGIGGRNADISVPYIEGDIDGSFTTELIREISQSTALRYSNTKGDAFLKIQILDIANDPIGYRRDLIQENGSYKENLRAAEGRRTIKVEASLLDAGCGDELWGPYIFVAEVDFDYVDQDALQDLAFVNPVTGPDTVLRFSLGQLEPIDNAQDAAIIQLFRKVSQKIIDAISSGW